MNKTQKYLNKDSGISRIIKNYEYRREQILMAEAVSKSIKTREHLIAEAGCGIGKSFAYLIPIILEIAGKKGERAVISTYTKALQQQLINKDIPLLQKALDVNFKAALCLGNKNYLCRRRLSTVRSSKLFDSEKETRQIKLLNQWADKTSDGIKFNLEFKVMGSLWNDVCRDPELCTRDNCSYFNDCFYMKARQAQKESDILILNHHLLFHDVNSGYNILPRYNIIVFDEAHNLEDVASDTMGLKVSRFRVKYLMSKIFAKKSERSLLNRTKDYLPAETAAKIKKAVTSVKRTNNAFFSNVLDEFGINDVNFRIHNKFLFDNIVSEPLKILTGTLSEATDAIENEDILKEYKAYKRRCLTISDELEIIMGLKYNNYVYYLNIESGSGRIYVSFNASPVEVSAVLNEYLFDTVHPVILTSATLTVNKSFDFIRERTGIPDRHDELILDSPFNYKNNVILYSPYSRIPDPAGNPDGFTEAVIENSAEILEITRGKTFILFTSYSMLNNVAEELINRFPKLKFLIHGEAPHGQLLKGFTENDNSVLLGTNTFWQGVDLPGKLLQCVIITKLPFSVPTDPITEARIELLRQHGHNPFMDYQVPVAALLFKQGFGRLIRHRKDFGITAILDPRIHTKQYGKVFIESLPRCSRAKDINDLKMRYLRLENR
jgi:ATP-dependent DNA helicase DinG